jgi:hypothetical protein
MDFVRRVGVSRRRFGVRRYPSLRRIDMDEVALTEIFDKVRRGLVVDGWSGHSFQGFDALILWSPHLLFARRANGTWVVVP